MTVFQKYASAIFSLLILVLGAVAPVAAAGKIDDVTLGQLITLTASSVVMYLVPLVPVRFSGIVKSAVEFAGAAIVLVLPFLFAGGITAEQTLLVIVGVIKAFATTFGVAIRTDNQTATPVVAVDPAQLDLAVTSEPSVRGRAFTTAESKHFDD